MGGWAETFEALRQDFLAAAPERLAHLSRALDALEAAPANRPELENATRQLHGFAGSGATYGFPRVSALGHEGEEAAAGRLREHGPADRTLLAHLRRIEAGLAAELAVR